MITAFVDNDVINALKDLKDKSNKGDKQNIKVEFIDTAPLTAVVTYDGSDANITIYVRDELHSDGQVASEATVNAGNLSSDDENAEVSFAVAEGVNYVLKERGLFEECAKLDETKQGVFLGLNQNNEITVKIVEGKKRPQLLCTSLFGEPRMMRPYSDEIMSQFVIDSMSFEEKEKAANEGNPDAMENLALLYLNGDKGTEVNPEKAYDWFLKCAETGNEQAMFNVGLLTAKGFGTRRNFTKAAKWMRNALEGGYEDAKTIAPEFERLAKAEKEAKTGDPQAQAEVSGGLMRLADSLEQAGTEKDYKESVKWAKKAVEQENADGYWYLALAYEHGRGVKPDMSKAIELYQKGAAAGSSECKLNLASEYLSGEHIRKNKKRGFALIKEAAENGYGSAMREMGRYYQFEDGTEEGLKKAVDWYEKALEVIEDPELAQRVAILRMMLEKSSEIGDDYQEDDDESLPDGYLEALERGTNGEDLNNSENDEDLNATDNEQTLLTQVVTKADGTKKEMAIWGGYELDGYDRTLNIFINQNDFDKIFHCLNERKFHSDNIFDPCKQDTGYQITVDYMDAAVTRILRYGEGKISLETYVRDERKTCQQINEELTREYETTDLEHIAEYEDDKTCLVLIVYFFALRKYLLEKSIVQKLYSMYDESAGVVVGVNRKGEITTKIVKGLERPDLPCMIFLLGKQMCRPYIDELLGLKSTGIRKPRDPELTAKIAAARANAEKEEKLKAAKKEADKKKVEKKKLEKQAAEKKKEKEEKKKKLERQKKKEAEEKRKKEKEIWQAKVKEIKKNRDVEKKKRLKLYCDEYEMSIAKIQSKRDSDVANESKKISELKERIARNKAELNNLGIFDFGKKKELKESIKQDTKSVVDAENAILSFEKNTSEETVFVEKTYKAKKDTLDTELDKEFVIPKSPEEIYRESRMTDAQRLVYETLKLCDGPVKITDLQKMNPELESWSIQKLAAILTCLKNERVVKLTEVRGKKLFELV